MVDEELFEAAVAHARRRFPKRNGVAAALRLDDGSVLTGVSLANFNAAVTLCAETGPICSAYSLDRAVVASVCVSVQHATGSTTVLAPCGACQERLALWGPEVRVAVAEPDSPMGWTSMPLRELHPHYWAASHSDDGRSWPGTSDHEW